MAMVVWRDELKLVSPPAAQAADDGRVSWADTAARFAIGFVLRFVAIALTAAVLLTALAGAAYLYGAPLLAPVEEQPILIPTPDPSLQPA